MTKALKNALAKSSLAFLNLKTLPLKTLLKQFASPKMVDWAANYWLQRLIDTPVF